MNEDIMLDKDGDLVVSENGDIMPTTSVCQAARIRLRWIQDEWRLGPELGFPYFDEVFIKNPDLERISELVKNEVMEVEGVNDANVVSASFDLDARSATFKLAIESNDEIYQEEVTLYA